MNLLGFILAYWLSKANCIEIALPSRGKRHSDGSTYAGEGQTDFPTDLLTRHVVTISLCSLDDSLLLLLNEG